MAWTAGNISARVPGADLLVIKPSGVSDDDLTGEAMVVCDLEANLVEGSRRPSSDTAAHAYVYKHMPAVGGVVHTHSDYATAWAARHEPIPCVLTMIADEFGGDIARTVHLARQLGEPVPIPARDIDKLFDRYQNVYGQGAGATPRTA